MALTVTFDELELNAARAALEDRRTAMARQLVNLRNQRDTPSNAEAVALTQAALRQTIRAQENINDRLDEEQQAADGEAPDYFALLIVESEARALWGDR